MRRNKGGKGPSEYLQGRWDNISLESPTSAVLDLDGAVTVELLDITIGGEAKGVLFKVEVRENVTSW
jgi:hypothetical protein